MATKKTTKRIPAKALKEQDQEAKRLTDLTERHPFKIGDQLPSDDVLLNVVRFGVEQSISESALLQSHLSVKENMNGVARRIAVEFKGYLAGEQVEAPVVGTVKRPATWWQMFKRDVLGYKDEDVLQEVIGLSGRATFEVVYPHLKLPTILPEIKGVLVRVRGVGPGKEYQTVGVK